ncbi:amine sulfotransferase-like isoform X1 [Varroa jacobsoni]|uniref:Sulfotransferase domain-containing protein n=1 Tax=Varroa destructor TaxID=109461 RepID=A0A7M7JGI4_VARDE|nr:amine sulfotransferase-like [Varroa destructor]XP_022706684.1 amine sulfotransferase-like isoform X1 [Varroa jacobsoni]
MKILDKLGDEVELLYERPKLATYDGVPMTANNFPIKFWRETRAYIPRDDDIFIVTYPKSGTTWLQQIMFVLFNGRHIKDISERYANCPFLEHSGSVRIETMRRPGAIKLHMRFEHAPYAGNAKYIYCVRNPKDCCVSFFYQSLKTVEHFSDCTFEEFFEYFMDGKCEFGNYWDHIESWYPHVTADNVLMVTYEDMKKNIARELGNIGNFIGGEWGQKLQSGERLQTVIRLSSFRNMRKLYENSLFYGENFLRKGTINDWETHMTPQMSQTIEDETYSRLEELCPQLLRKWESYGALSGNKKSMFY